MEINDKKVLIISHNPLSCVNNNGKTLVSIFAGVKESNIYQIYLNGDTPDYSDECHYLQINEKQIITSILRRKDLCCDEISATPGEVSSAKITSRSYFNHTKRLLRECIWKTGVWKKRLAEWLEGKVFDVVFFMAGDGLFAYDVYKLVMSHVTAKGCLFFTDDYIIGKTSRSPIALLRQLLLKKKMKKALGITDELYVISEEMRLAYQKLFNKDGTVIRNFSAERLQLNVDGQSVHSSDVKMVYAGGLHYNRWKVLAQIARSMREINSAGKAAYSLKIYSSQKISQEIIDQMTVDGVSEFMGGVSASQIAGVYSSADILVHVESFDKKAIASTKYSFSTKIPEYLSSGKCVFAVGPAEVASMQYLKDVACIVSDVGRLTDTLTELLDVDYRSVVRSRCEERYEKDFSERNQEDCLKRILSI